MIIKIKVICLGIVLIIPGGINKLPQNSVACNNKRLLSCGMSEFQVWLSLVILAQGLSRLQPRYQS